MQSFRQNLVQQQRLKLSPQLVQSIKLMALPLADLRERIVEEAESNPALEIVSDSFELTGWQRREIAPSIDYSPRANGDEESDDHRDFIEGALRRPETLQEHLLEQLGEIQLDDETRSLAELVVQNLDRDGFHLVPPGELPGGDNDRALSRALSAVRSLHPAGCATADFRESLIVQASLLLPEHRDPSLEAAIAILRDRFHLLEKGRPDALVKGLAKEPLDGFPVDAETAGEVFEIIRSLDPFPGRAFDTSPEAFVVPDVFVHRTEDGYSVVVNEEEIPVLGINPFFMELESGPSEDSEAKGARDFAREQLKEARWFMGSIERRNLTILKLARALVVYQRDFFAHGPTRIAPLRMKEIADEIGMHEATVSRAAKGKYLQCEWGIFELRSFFSNQVGGQKTRAAAGEGESQYPVGRFSKQGVKEIIRELIEASGEGLSDQKLSEQLAVRGIKIARRTVAKYRSELNLKSSFER
jgi:RNA polymerase sigma-54 factor